MSRQRKRTSADGPASERERPDALISITAEALDVARVIAAVAGKDAGAIVIFLGTVRATTGERTVRFLEYEAYTEMAEAAMREIALDLPRVFGACRVAIVHRIGRLEIGETSVAIAVASPHRRVAVAACADAIERLKKSVPIWKKEHFEGGAEWIEGEPSAAASEPASRHEPEREEPA